VELGLPERSFCLFDSVACQLTLTVMFCDLLERREIRVKYVTWYKHQTVKKDPKLHKSELAQLEKQLSFDDISLYRKIALLQIKKEEMLDKAAKKSGLKKKTPPLLKIFKIKSKDKDKDKDSKEISQINLSEVRFSSSCYWLLRFDLFYSFWINNRMT